MFKRLSLRFQRIWFFVSKTFKSISKPKIDDMGVRWFLSPPPVRIFQLRSPMNTGLRAKIVQMTNFRNQRRQQVLKNCIIRNVSSVYHRIVSSISPKRANFETYVRSLRTIRALIEIYSAKILVFATILHSKMISLSFNFCN